MKKSLWIVLLLTLVCTLALSACDDTNQPQTPNEDHVHAFSEWTTVKDATCTVKGEQERTCSCGEKETKSIDATGHTEVVDAAVVATCTTDGKTEGKHCSVCSETLIAQSNIPASHTDGEWVVDTNATCTVDGSQHQVCSVCNASIKTEPIAATGHTDGEWVIDSNATCTVDGSKHQVCSVCNASIKTEAIAATGHTDGEWVVDTNATCTEDGNKHQVCSVCSASIKTATIAATGHTDGAWVIDTNATCTEDGSKHQVCSVCNASIKTEAIAATGHTDGEWITDTNATCTVDGSKHQVCSVCNASIKTEAIAATGHTDGEWVIDTNATCTEDGSKHQVCSVCNASIKTEVVAAKGHIEVIDAYVAATCTTDGKTAGKHCSRCNNILIAQTIIPKFGHTEVMDVAIPVTCITDGKTEGMHCSVCETVFIKQEIINATGHNYQEDYVIDSYDTSMYSGEKSRHCSLCDAKIDVTEFHATIVNGILKDEQLHWTKEYSPYCITGNVLVSSNKTLIIDPGVIVYIDGAYLLQVEGILKAIGTKEENIYFYGVGEGKNTWRGIKVSGQDFAIEGAGAEVVFKSGSILNYANINDCAGGLKGEFYIENTQINTSKWAIGEGSLVDSRFTGIVKNSIINGQVDAFRGKFTAFINCEINTPYLLSASETSDSQLAFYGCKITHKNDSTIGRNGQIQIGSSNYSRENLFVIFDNTLIEGFSYIVIRNSTLLTFKNSNIRYVDNFATSSDITVHMTSCDVVSTNLSFGGFVETFSQNNLVDTVIEIWSNKSVHAEIDMRNNYWGESNLTELENSDSDSNISFIIDFYDYFDRSKIVYENYAVVPFKNSGIIIN